MAKELAHFKNFAKLKDTSLEFNDITVLAGKPSTGKSYVMKFMYAVEEAYFVSSPNIQELLNNIPIKGRSDSSKANFIYDRLLDLSTNNSKSIPTYSNTLKNILNSIFINLNQVSINFEFISSFLDISYKNYFNIKQKKEKIVSKEIIFVETPLILEFKSFMRREKGKVPYHIESLLNILDTNYSFTDEEQDRFIQNFTKKSKEIISGDIESSGDSFIYRTDTTNYDILNTSSGTKSIGLLQYLVTNKALKKGSILFWEEPEVHLHPQWQLKMVDLFVELMNAGVKIVFSTHSPYMADYLNAISQKRGFRDRVSFNVLEEKDGIVSNYILDDNNWNILQKELMDTFEDILWQYL